MCTCTECICSNNKCRQTCSTKRASYRTFFFSLSFHIIQHFPCGRSSAAGTRKFNNNDVDDKLSCVCVCVGSANLPRGVSHVWLLVSGEQTKRQNQKIH